MENLHLTGAQEPEMSLFPGLAAVYVLGVEDFPTFWKEKNKHPGDCDYPGSPSPLGGSSIYKT